MTTQTIHLVFKTHLDLGFTALARDVRARYHEDFIPRALDTAEALYADDPGNPMFVWTTGSWLIWDHLENTTRAAAQRLERAIERGLIRWHALPFTLHSELMSADLFRFGLDYSADLDRRFGVATRAAKMTDVPGHSRGIVPLLADAGVTYLHLGVNEASPVPHVPRMFRWQVEGREILVHYESSYGGVSQLPQSDVGMAFAHAGDNLGPPGVPQVADAWRVVQHRHPAARVIASSLEPFAAAAAEVRHHLPVLDAEIGDSWIHGVGTDPVKVSRFVALQRLFSRFVAEGLTPARRNFGRALLFVPEHTWGLDIKSYLRDEAHWDRPAFEAARTADPRFAKVEESWAEQAAYCDAAVAALDTADRPVDAETPAGATAASLTITGDRRIALPASPGGTAGPSLVLRYQSFTSDDMAAHMDAYLTTRPLWAIYDHGKPGLAAAKTARSCNVAADVNAGKGGTIDLSFPADLVRTLGAPSSGRLSLSVNAGGEQTLELSLSAKPANRMPEAISLDWSLDADPGTLRLNKLGLWNDPNRQVGRAGAALQAVAAIRWQKGGLGYQLTPLDSPLVMPLGTPLMPQPHTIVWSGEGVTFLLFNTKWGTNFPMWGSGNWVFRFRLQRV